MFLYSPGLDVRPGQARRTRSGQTAGNSTTWNGVGGLCSTPAGEPTQLTPAPSTNECAHPRRTVPPSPPSQCAMPPPTALQRFGSEAKFVKLEIAGIRLNNEPNQRPSRGIPWATPGRCQKEILSPSPPSCSQSQGPAAWEGVHGYRTRQASEVGPTEPRLFVFPCKNANQSKTLTQQTNKQNILSWLFAHRGGQGRQPEGFLYDQRRF